MRLWKEDIDSIAHSQHRGPSWLSVAFQVFLVCIERWLTLPNLKKKLGDEIQKETTFPTASANLLGIRYIPPGTRYSQYWISVFLVFKQSHKQEQYCGHMRQCYCLWLECNLYIIIMSGVNFRKCQCLHAQVLQENGNPCAIFHEISMCASISLDITLNTIISSVVVIHVECKASRQPFQAQFHHFPSTYTEAKFMWYGLHIGGLHLIGTYVLANFPNPRGRRGLISDISNYTEGTVCGCIQGLKVNYFGKKRCLPSNVIRLNFYCFAGMCHSLAAQSLPSPSPKYLGQLR